MPDTLNPAAQVLPSLEDALYCGDASTLLTSFAPCTVDLIVTDPPYGVGSLVSRAAGAWTDIMNNESPDFEWLPLAYQALRDTGAIYTFCTWRNCGAWAAAHEAAGFEVKDMLVWDKVAHGMGDTKGQYAPQHEFIVFAVKGRHLLRGGRPSNVIRYERVHHSSLCHPYEKPVGLLQKLIYTSSDPGALVVDPFAGSGSTLLAARDAGRRWSGAEIDPKYQARALARLAMPTTQALFVL